MNTLQLICFALAIANTFSATCTAANYCMGCNATTANQCDSCFNWGKGSVGVRALNSTVIPNNCQTKLTLTVTDCKYYWGTTSTTATTRGSTTCWHCTKDFLTYNAGTNAVSCTSTAPTGCTKKANCLTTYCYSAVSTWTTTNFGCRVCKKNYYPVTNQANSTGSASCTSGNSITNCEFSFFYGSTQMYCYSCKKGFAVASDDKTCVTYSADSNCRKLASGNTACATCWHSYYWDTSKCKLAAKVLTASLLAFIGIFFA